MDSRILTPVQQAVVALRDKLEISQQMLAEELGVSKLAVVRWENHREPQEFYIFLLASLARFKGHPKIANVFWGELCDQRPQLREWEEANRG